MCPKHATVLAHLQPLVLHLIITPSESPSPAPVGPSFTVPPTSLLLSLCLLASLSLQVEVIHVHLEFFYRNPDPRRNGISNGAPRNSWKAGTGGAGKTERELRKGMK
jgi:hypothetical protein